MASHLAKQFAFSSSAADWHVIHCHYHFFVTALAVLHVNSVTGQQFIHVIYQVKMVDDSIKCTKMFAITSICLLRQHCWSERSAVS